MLKFAFRLLLVLAFLAAEIPSVAAESMRFRCMWRDNPATTMVIGWDQISGTDVKLYYDRVDHGRSVGRYAVSLSPSRTVKAKGMNNYFVRLANLRPNTTYYFVVADSDGVSSRMSFKTAPDNPSERLSIIAGGDSRNHRDARRNANKIVGKLRPHFIMFSGDMTDGDTGTEWIEWFDDWQLTMGSDGRLFPVLVTRGNHEASNQPLIDLFDVKNSNIYYAHSFGGNLLRVYTLNTLIPSGGSQKNWLQNDLSNQRNTTWKFVQYHQAISPHSAKKPEKTELILNWATLFYKFGVDLAVESDAHVVKWTYPIKPSKGPGSEQGFERDDERGTVFIGEGCWGAPLRKNDDNKSWTRSSGSFNQFKWIFVDQEKIEVRTIKTDGSSRVREINHDNVFEIPPGLSLWNPPEGKVLYIPEYYNDQQDNFTEDLAEEAIALEDPELEVTNFYSSREGNKMRIQWNTQQEPNAVSYEVQRSVNGESYTTIAFVDSKGAGENSYQCFDRELGYAAKSERLSYRLKCTGPNGNLQLFKAKIRQAPPGTGPGPGRADRIPGGPKENKPDWSSFPKLVADRNTGQIKVKYVLAQNSNVVISLINRDFKEIARLPYTNQPAGPHTKALNIKKAPSGKYLIVIKANKKVINRYQVIK